LAAENSRTFVGFGFGAIQAGLFAFEALRSRRFARVVVAEVAPALVRAVRQNDGRFALNVAHRDRIESLELGPIEMLDPQDPDDACRIVDALVEASEAATAVPAVDFYSRGGDASIASFLARAAALRSGAPLVVYAAENDNHAATKLRSAVLAACDSTTRERVSRSLCCVDTVIGKMSGVISEPAEITHRRLLPLTPSTPRAVLVESFRNILVTSPRAVCGHDVARGIDVFVEKDELLPFEDAKLYGHNAVHALAGYLAHVAGFQRMDELHQVDGALDFVRDAFLDECGSGLIARHRGIDTLFTPRGFADYVDDLIERMFNPLLGDRVERVTRDPRRKLGWSDRLVGAMRLTLAAGVEPRRLARGAAAALLLLAPASARDPELAERTLRSAWLDAESPRSPDGAEAHAVVRLVLDAAVELGCRGPAAAFA